MSKLQVYLCRHGETEWTLSGQHTSVTDIPLTANGEVQAQKLKERLQGIEFSKIYVSPLQRARQTCQIAGYLDRAEVDDDLFEWRYGEVEGLTTSEYRKTHPGWTIFNDGAHGSTTIKGKTIPGETIQEVSDRADQVIERVRGHQGIVALFSSGHFLRVLAARWCGFEAADGRSFKLTTGSLCILGYERDVPVIDLWNCTDFL